MAASAPTGSKAAVPVTSEQVLGYRFSAQQLDRSAVDGRTEAAVLDIGVQDTGTDGAGWALANRGVEGPFPTLAEDDRVLVWTLRGAPHVYRRADVAAVAAATAPFSSADAGKRIFDAARPLRAAGIDPNDALDAIAAHLRDIVRGPMVKGEVSRELTARLDPPYLRECRPCKTTHAYEQPFRLAALRAGLELAPGTSPPLLRRIPGWRGPAKRVAPRLDTVRSYLRLLGPATPKHVAGYLDAALAEVKKRWPDDVAAVDVEGERRWLLSTDADALRGASVDSSAVRLLSPFDLFLQARDRDLLVTDAARRTLLWPVIGRPGAVCRGGEIVGTWRPRAGGVTLKLAVQLWTSVRQQALSDQAERLSAHRGLRFAGFLDTD